MSQLTRTIFLLLGILALFIVIQSFVPMRTAIKIGADEDWELSKAILALKGYHFYTDIWNDQPLLHTSIITSVLRNISPSVLGPRLVTSGFSALLLTSVFLVAYRLKGLLVAALAALLLMASPGFLELSSSCMVEIPALAPAVAAIAVLLSASQTKYPAWVCWTIAGLFFGISLQIKFINLVLLPLVALILWLQRSAAFTPLKETTTRGGPGSRGVDETITLKRVLPDGHQRRAPLMALVVFGLSLLITFVTITFITGAGAYWTQLKQSWSAHFAATKSFEYGSPADHPFEWSVYLKNWDTTLPALLGIIYCCVRPRRHPLLALPASWFALQFVVFGIHKPWWSYYYIHNAVPLALCAAIGIAEVAHWLRARQKMMLTVLAGVVGLGFAAWMGTRVYLQITQIRKSPQLYSALVLKEIDRYKPFTRFIYTDEPAYSFHSAIPMPPALAVITLKRLWSGDMTNVRLVEELKVTKPELMLLKNQTAELPFSDWLQSEYRLVYQDSRHNLYAHKSVANKVQW